MERDEEEQISSGRKQSIPIAEIHNCFLQKWSEYGEIVGKLSKKSILCDLKYIFSQ